MKLDELLEQQSLILPKNWQNLGYASYYECVVSESSKFLYLLENLDDTQDFGKDEFIGELSKEHLIAVSSKFYLMVIKALQCYCNEGNPHKTYNFLNESLITKSENPYHKPLIYYLEFDNLHPVHYRLRKMQGEADFGDMFHVPFESRHIINTNRYSIPGYPTLYLSNSIYLAYKELGEPDYNDLYVSKFFHTRHYNPIETLLDLTNKPLWDTVESKFKFLARWILTMSCSIKVGFPTSPFKPEYILPQIIFQLVKNKIDIGSRKIIGVKYSSTKIVDSREGFQGHFYNTAIPIHHSNKNGFCDVLAKQFCMTRPISFHKALEYSKEVCIHGQVKSIELNGASTEYIKTDFGKIEQVLSDTLYSKLNYVNGKKFK